MLIRTIARRAAVLLSILAAAAGGIIIDSHRIVGTLLIAIGIVGAMYMYLSSEASQGKNEEFFETTAQMLSVAGLGNPYTKQIYLRLAKGGGYKNILADLEMALAVDPSDTDALTLYMQVSAIELSFERHLAGKQWKPDKHRLKTLLEHADRGILSGKHLTELRSAKGILLDIAGEHAQARTQFKESGRNTSDAYWRLAISTSFGMEKQFAVALSEMETAIKEGAKGPTVDFYYARALSSMGHYKRAIDLFEQIREERGNYFFLLEELKEAYWLSWHPFQAAYLDLLCALHIFRRNPASAFKYVAFGFVKLLLPFAMVGLNAIQAVARRLPKLRDTKLATLNEPGNPEAAMGMALVAQGKFNSACVQFSAAACKTTSAGVWLNLCSSAIMAGNWAEAERAYAYLDVHYPQEIPKGYLEAIADRGADLHFDVNVGEEQQIRRRSAHE
jgi:tetratricopeptide (TPR) repeat protein